MKTCLPWSYGAAIGGDLLEAGALLWDARASLEVLTLRKVSRSELLPILRNAVAVWEPQSVVHYTPGDLRLLVILLLVVLHQLLRVFSGFAIDLLGVV